MLKTISAALVAVSVLAAPAIAASQRGSVMTTIMESAAPVRDNPVHRGSPSRSHPGQVEPDHATHAITSPRVPALRCVPSVIARGRGGPVCGRCSPDADRLHRISTRHRPSLHTRQAALVP